MAERPSRKKPVASTGENSDTLTVADIKELFSLMKQNEIAELNLEQKDTKIHIVSTHAPVVQQSPMVQMMPGMTHMGMMGMPQPGPQAPAPAPLASAPAAAPEALTPAADTAPSNLTTVASPMVGTFYRSPAPDAPPFVKVGDSVGDDTTLCIIEAMKLMNEIKAETKGRVYKILVENGVPVEYNQPIFLIEPE